MPGWPSLLTACCEAGVFLWACKSFSTGGMAGPGNASRSASCRQSPAVWALQECAEHMKIACACQAKNASSGLSLAGCCPPQSRLARRILPAPLQARAVGGNQQAVDQGAVQLSVCMCAIEFGQQAGQTDAAARHVHACIWSGMLPHSLCGCLGIRMPGLAGRLLQALLPAQAQAAHSASWR